MIDLSFILPVHNEQDIIKEVFIDLKKELDQLDISCQWILVENGSTDNSWEVIKKLAKEYKNTKAIMAQKGYGSAVLAGLDAASGEYVCYLPSDGQINPKIIKTLWKLIKSDCWGTVKIKRINRENLWRKIVSHFFSLLISILWDSPLIDINGSPRICLRQNLLLLRLKSKDSFIDAEYAIKAHYLGWKIKEVPTKTFNRKGGKSTRTLKTYLEFIGNIFKYKLWNGYRLL